MNFHGMKEEKTECGIKIKNIESIYKKKAKVKKQCGK